MRTGSGRGQGIGIDGVSTFLGFRWEHANTIRLTIEERHINAAGLLSGR